MSLYGSVISMQELAWGGPKDQTPDIVNSVQATITTMINIILNRSENYTTVPTMINDIANAVGATMLKKSEKPLTEPEIFQWLKVLLSNYVDQSPEGEVRWGNVRWI